MKKIKLAILVSICVSVSLNSMAWGVLGHRIVGQVADSYLTKKAKKEIARILGNESVAMTSNWPDFIKSDPSYRYLSSWHYINLKAGLTETEVKNELAADTATDVYTKINWLAAQLKNKSLETDKKRMYLRLLIHMAGDIHQPFHVGRPDDQGGNKISVTWFGDPSNLHQVWDSKLVDFQQLSYTEYTKSINHTTKKQRKEWMAEPVNEWIWQSYQQAAIIYNGTKLNDKLGFEYNFNYIALVNQQLLKGGVHLAGLLNQVFQ